MLHLILLFGLFCQIGYSQTACRFFSSAEHNYTAWSESHIATWCKDHDPSSTSQCARAVVWPSDIQYPERVELRRNLKERLLQLEPRIGTRKDCIARSSALQLNSTRYESGLSEAVTCDLYSFHPKRRDECVCVPVYKDYVTLASTTIDDVYRVLETTSVFYPPAQVVENYLLAAATQGPPTVCNPYRSSCQESVEVLRRKSKVLGHFPYCSTAPSPNSWGPLPTGPDCERDDEEESLCKNDKCMWGFIKPWASPTVKLATVTGSDGVSLFGSVTESITITTPHWGFLAPATTAVRSTVTTTSTYNTSRFKSKKPKSSAHPTSTPAPVCVDELDCREYCDRRIKAPKKHMMALLIGGTAFTGIAGLAMLLKIYSRYIHRWCRSRNEQRRSAEKDTGCLTDAGSVQGLQLVQTPSAQARSRGHVRFQFDGANSAVDVFDGSDHDFRRA
ncbi:hypothetical protein E4T50_15604 [Aureobasidium sp. EXF-12298]|nr:hypothetical protein E4T50_15604 [Aureobasidium sp. EXF-12298]